MLTCHMRRAGTHSSLARPPPRPVGTIATRTIIRTDPHLFSRRLCRRAGAERYSGFAVCLLAGHASVARCLPRAHTGARMLLRAGAGPTQDGLAVGIRARREARGARREARGARREARTCAVRPGPAVRVGAGGGARTPRASRRRQGGGRAAAPLRIQSNCMLPSRGSPPQRCAAGMRLGARGASRAARRGGAGIGARARARQARAHLGAGSPRCAPAGPASAGVRQRRAVPAQRYAAGPRPFGAGRSSWWRRRPGVCGTRAGASRGGSRKWHRRSAPAVCGLGAARGQSGRRSRARGRPRKERQTPSSDFTSRALETEATSNNSRRGWKHASGTVERGVS